VRTLNRHANADRPPPGALTRVATPERGLRTVRGLVVWPVSWLGVRCDPVQQRLTRDANAARTEPDCGELACADEVVDLRAAEAQELGGFRHGQQYRLLFLGHSSLAGLQWNYWD